MTFTQHAVNDGKLIEITPNGIGCTRAFVTHKLWKALGTDRRHVERIQRRTFEQLTGRGRPNGPWVFAFELGSNATILLRFTTFDFLGIFSLEEEPPPAASTPGRNAP